MNKKVLILASVASLAVAGVTATALASSSFRPLGVEATPNEYIFKAGNGQFEGGDPIQQVNVATGVSDPLFTSVSLVANEGEVNKNFNDALYFVRNGSTITNPTFTITIGVNNATSVRVVYGVLDEDATYVSCDINLKNKLGAKLFEKNQLLQKDESDDLAAGDLTWTLETENEIKEVEIVVETDKNIHWATPFFIKSITLGWSC